ILTPSALVFKNHPTIAVELAFVGARTADEGEFHDAGIDGKGRGDGSADAAAVPLGVGEAVPIDTRGLEPPHQDARGPIRRRGNGRRGMGNDTSELRVLRNLDGQQLAFAILEWAPGPEDDAMRIGVARGDAFGIET